MAKSAAKTEKKHRGTTKSADFDAYLGEADLLLLNVREASAPTAGEDGLAVRSLDFVQSSGSVADGGHGLSTREELLGELNVDGVDGKVLFISLVSTRRPT